MGQHWRAGHPGKGSLHSSISWPIFGVRTITGCCTLPSLELTPRVTHTMKYPDAALWAVWDFAAAKAEICGFAMANGGALVQDSYITPSQFDGQAPTHSLAFRERGGVTPKNGRSLSAITRAYHTQTQHRVS